MTPLYPLHFRPVLKRYLWGGRGLGEVLGKPIGEGSDYAESWEIADHPQGQSLVANGPLAGTSLSELVLTRGRELFGKHEVPSRFPLIFKLLDCHQDLSVQVHPNDLAAANLDPPDLGKTEAWVILSAAPGGRVYAGLKKGCDFAGFSRALREGRVAEQMHSFEPRPGDCIFIPAGTIHALGAGLMVAEIQQASDTTYRLYDWGRVGADGKPRALHIEQGLAAIDFSAVEVSPQKVRDGNDPGCECLVACDRFVLLRWQIDREIKIGGDDRFHILCVVEGAVRLVSDAGQLEMPQGQTVLLPASVSAVLLQPTNSATVLEMTLPD
jgi:mannose-6-phosphate isomerase